METKTHTDYKLALTHGVKDVLTYSATKHAFHSIELLRRWWSRQKPEAMKAHSLLWGEIEEASYKVYTSILLAEGQGRGYRPSAYMKARGHAMQVIGLMMLLPMEEEQLKLISLPIQTCLHYIEQEVLAE